MTLITILALTGASLAADVPEDVSEAYANATAATKALTSYDGDDEAERLALQVEVDQTFTTFANTCVGELAERPDLAPLCASEITLEEFLADDEEDEADPPAEDDSPDAATDDEEADDCAAECDDVTDDEDLTVRIEPEPGLPYIPARTTAVIDSNGVIYLDVSNGDEGATVGMYNYWGMLPCGVGENSGYYCLVDSDGELTTTVVHRSCFDRPVRSARYDGTDTCPTVRVRNQDVDGLTPAMFASADQAWTDTFSAPAADAVATGP